VKERQRWDDYMEAYEDMIRNTAAPYAPWYVVPADHKWYTHAVVSSAIIQTLKDLKLAFPTVDKSRRKELEAARASLLKEKD